MQSTHFMVLHFGNNNTWRPVKTAISTFCDLSRKTHPWFPKHQFICSGKWLELFVAPYGICWKNHNGNNLCSAHKCLNKCELIHFRCTTLPTSCDMKNDTFYENAVEKATTFQRNIFLMVWNGSQQPCIKPKNTLHLSYSLHTSFIMGFLLREHTTNRIVFPLEYIVCVSDVHIFWIWLKFTRNINLLRKYFGRELSKHERCFVCMCVFVVAWNFAFYVFCTKFYK